MSILDQVRKKDEREKCGKRRNVLEGIKRSILKRFEQRKRINKGKMREDSPNKYLEGR